MAPFGRGRENGAESGQIVASNGNKWQIAGVWIWLSCGALGQPENACAATAAAIGLKMRAFGLSARFCGFQAA
jgi:hypothetical protein